MTANTSLDVEGTIRGKIGFAWDHVLIYGTGGVAFGSFSTDLSLIANAPFFVAARNPCHNRVGWTAGGGLQYAVTNNWWVFAEYRYTNLGAINFNNAFVATALPAGGSSTGAVRSGITKCKPVSATGLTWRRRCLSSLSCIS